MPASRITQADIAKKVGVSQSTVSQVLSDMVTTTISPSTCERILRVAKEMGYHRHSAPQHSSRKKTKNVGFLIPEGYYTEHLMVYIRRLHAGVLEQLDAKGFHLIQSIIHPDEPLPSLIHQHKVDGVIIEDRCDSELVRRIQEFVPVMLLNFNLDFVDVDSFMPDNVGGVWQAMQYLHGLGHRRIAIFGMEPTQIHHAERISSYRRSQEMLNLVVDEAYDGMCEPQRHGDPDEVDDFATQTLLRWRALPNPPTAVMTLTDGYALFLLRAARSLGINVPQDLSIVGFDNTPMCEHTEPRLTSVDQPMEQMGQAACRTLMSRLEGTDMPIQKLRLGVKLIERDSTGPAPCE